MPCHGRLGHTTVVPDLLYKSRILIIHLGPALLPVPTGLLYIPDEDSVIPTTNLERTLRLGARLRLKLSLVLMLMRKFRVRGRLMLRLMLRLGKALEWA